MAIEPAAISAIPPVMMSVVVSAAPVKPAARANGTVRPSDIPITMSRTIADDVKCFSTCGVVGIVNSILNGQLTRYFNDHGILPFAFAAKREHHGDDFESIVRMTAAADSRRKRFCIRRLNG